MSSVPYTDLRVNPGGIDVFHFDDYVYLMAPALQGGMLLDDFGAPVINKTGQVTFVSKIIGSVAACEQEFGLASAGSPMSIYARWILDRVKVPLVCRRVVGSNLASAYTILNNDVGVPILWLESKAKTELANRIMLDITESSLAEFFFRKPNASFFPDTNTLHVDKKYSSSDKLIFDGIYLSDINFRVIIDAQEGIQDYNLFNFRIITIEDEDKQYVRVSDGVSTQSLKGNQFSFYPATREIAFGVPPKKGLYSLIVHGQDFYGNSIRLCLNPDGAEQIFKISFEPGSVVFNRLFVNGYGTENVETETNIARLFTLKNAPSQDIRIICSRGTILNTTKLTIIGVINGVSIVEEFDDIISYRDLILRINNATTGSNFIKGELWLEEDQDISVPLIAETSFTKVGFQATLYLDGYTETYDNLRDAAQLQFELNYKSLLARAAVLNHADAEKPKAKMIGTRLRNGNSGLNPTTADYLEALAEAENINYITIVIAPGVADANFHALMKKHCHEMFRYGKYRTTIVGGNLNETPETKKNRALMLSHERISVLGDGLRLISPVTGEPEMFSPAICTAAFTAQLLSEYYFVSQTHKIMESAKGVEHEYDDAQLEDLHNSRLVLFQKNKFGTQIVDGITTSPLNAYEDIHMVRIFDTISRNIKKIMERTIGQNNVPTTWANVLSSARRMLELMKNADAIQDYRFITEVRPQDLIDKRYKFKIGIVPTFPVKYIEGFIDVFPPYAVET